jgi:CO/xanthine dehydrogenase Mo-binding subunit
MDPVEIRLKNINEKGGLVSNRPYNNPGLRDCIVKAAEAIGWKEKWHAPKAKEVRPGVFHGIAIAAHTCSHGSGGAPSTAMIIANPGSGAVDINSAASEVGPGQRTTMAMICAEALGIPYELVNITVGVDTAYTTDTGNTAGSRQTLSGGWGVFEAAMDAKKQILVGAAEKFVADAKAKQQTITVAAEDLDIVNGEVISKKDAALKMKFGDAVAAVADGSPVIGRGVHVHEPDWERLAFASHAAEVEVDTGTGTVKVIKYVAAHDIGRAINPFGVEQHIEGGVIMALGQALTEELLVDKSTGLPINGNILDYKMLSIKDVPRKIDVIQVEKPKDYGVFGAHGVGEPPAALAQPLIANAVYNAIGVWIGDMPITRVKILNALRSA